MKTTFILFEDEVNEKQNEGREGQKKLFVGGGGEDRRVVEQRGKKKTRKEVKLNTIMNLKTLFQG